MYSMNTENTGSVYSLNRNRLKIFDLSLGKFFFKSQKNYFDFESTADTNIQTLCLTFVTRPQCSRNYRRPPRCLSFLLPQKFPTTVFFISDSAVPYAPTLCGRWALKKSPLLLLLFRRSLSIQTALINLYANVTCGLYSVRNKT